jgi:hypothetical protein
MPHPFRFSALARPALLGLAALAVLVALAGCSHLSARHLHRQPWVLNVPQSLAMTYWTFDFEAVPSSGKFTVRGEARPRREAVAPDLDRVDDLWLAAYLCDAKGRVLTKAIAFNDPATLDFGRPVPFSFTLSPKDVEGGPLFIAFGYRMVLSSSHGAPTGPAGETRRTEPFFASEGAVTRY